MANLNCDFNADADDWSDSISPSCSIIRQNNLKTGSANPIASASSVIEQSRLTKTFKQRTYKKEKKKKENKNIQDN